MGCPQRNVGLALQVLLQPGALAPELLREILPRPAQESVPHELHHGHLIVQAEFAVQQRYFVLGQLVLQADVDMDRQTLRCPGVEWLGFPVQCARQLQGLHGGRKNHEVIPGK
eukprot:CAMPEP_0204368496 /NCGR_PEP_ID=MMETSP0469-20131031/44220_1 /ASSEMBLY_ACC=CAM_ASM_000384 /TAXON_ID=2969 /ORGANISM="Oxyrrhis marina" /LENGTH=112 /DNA_ID=CAMNT_0051358059 /DNA_START=419 /DNA_END=757 /DNA_ORIENTATION=+